MTPLQVRFWPVARLPRALQSICQPVYRQGHMPAGSRRCLHSFSSQRTMARVRRLNRVAVKNCPAARLPASP